MKKEFEEHSMEPEQVTPPAVQEQESETKCLTISVPLHFLLKVTFHLSVIYILIFLQ